ncbi:hypothetical protein [Methylobacterium nodulans]|uniref:Acetylornithine deacetylase n=1 Tax=Methylobacterium nodulans (strain LMG 21967 / CNCM I-2342 / ORS 2060) TaxID=460265 RepID=B8IWQ6_METNO|nr:hypothetical protein [Methylobacterium nodulans]ACL62947.1 hypothetical protein Mnod_7943 [Methylobacterium nodulans ORS 2060]
MGQDVVFDLPLADLPAVGTEPSDRLAMTKSWIVREVTQAAGEVIGMPCFTDGSVLQGAFGRCPTVILGPGEHSQAHQTNECYGIQWA